MAKIRALKPAIDDCEAHLSAFLADHDALGLPMAGPSVHFDRGVLRRWFRRFDQDDVTRLFGGDSDD